MRKLLIFSIVFILLVGIGFVNAGVKITLAKPEILDNIGGVGDPQFFEGKTNIGEIIGVEKDITGEEVEYQQLNEEGGAHLVFIEKGARVDFEGNSFGNITPQDNAGHPSFINIDREGNIARADFTVNEEGGTYVFGNTKINAPPNSRVFFDQETGVRIKVPEDSEITEIPTTKNNSLPSDYTTTIEGENIKLPGSNILSGKINYDNGQAFVILKDETIVNGVELTNKIRSKDYLNLFFDGQGHEGDYVSFDLKNKKFILSSSSVPIDILSSKPIANFKEGNPFIKIDKDDHVAMQALSGGKISILSGRINPGTGKKLIPRVITKGEFIIDEDYKHFIIENNEVISFKTSKLFYAKGSSTSPIELFAQDKDGNNILKKGAKIIVDNFNRIAMGPDIEEFLASSEGIDTLFSSRIHYNYPTEESIKKLTGLNIIFNDVSQGNKDLVLGRLRDYWKTLNQETKNSIKILEFGSDNYFLNKLNQPLVTNAFAEPNGQATFRAKELSMNLKTFRHESAHLRHYQVIRDYNPKLTEIMYELSKLEEPSSSEYIKLRKKFFLIVKEEESKLSTFGGKWKEIAGTDYDLYDEFGGGYVMDPKNKGAKYGLIRSYGGKNIFEDIATFVEEVNNPSFFKPLINPQDDKYDVRYEQKLALLHEYKFISDEEYNKILEVAEV
tara:strand:+ start:14934 stop:16946 length:2013 start_codon:yes stop_codon:yes gene_type:complete